MNKQKTILIWFVLSAISITEILKYRYYIYLFDGSLNLSSFYSIVDLAAGLFTIVIDVFMLILAIKALSASTTTAKDKAYSLLRYVYVMKTIMTFPVFIFRGILYHGSTTTGAMINFYFWIAVDIALFIFLLINKPERQIEKVNIQEYDMVAFTSGGHRFAHYLLDLLFLLPFWLYMFETYSIAARFFWRYANLGNDASLVEVLLQFGITGSYLVYCFFSEAIFKQTFGKIITGSVVVSNGVELSRGRVFLRTLSRLIPFDTFSFLFGGKWHDKISHTAVVYADSWEKAFDFEQKQDAAQ